MITTNLESRTSLMLNTVDSLKKHEDYFNQKIMSVDIFYQGLALGWYNKFEKEGWNILSKNVSARASMILNQRNVVSNATSEIVLYTEDDILINTLPKLSTINRLFNEKLVNGKRTGFICFNNHVWSKFNQNPKHIINFIHDLDNYITVDGDVFLIKNEVIKDKYYLNFPASLTTKKLFLELEDYAFINKVGWAIEHALTSVWFETKKDLEYEVLISLKPQIIDDIKNGKKISVLEFYKYANINFWNNDVSLRHQVTPGREEGCSI
ncbi:MAG: hypothetical protein ABIO02_00455 [Patescibacteria group bacterium]